MSVLRGSLALVSAGHHLAACHAAICSWRILTAPCHFTTVPCRSWEVTVASKDCGVSLAFQPAPLAVGGSGSNSNAELIPYIRAGSKKPLEGTWRGFDGRGGKLVLVLDNSYSTRTSKKLHVSLVLDKVDDAVSSTFDCCAQSSAHNSRLAFGQSYSR